MKKKIEGDWHSAGSGTGRNLIEGNGFGMKVEFCIFTIDYKTFINLIFSQSVNRNIMANELETSVKWQIKSIIERTRELFETNILHETSSKNVIRKSVLIEILVHMKDLLIQSRNLIGKRVSFKDDVTPDQILNIYDVTDLICNFRDALCHNNSFKKKFSNHYIGFGMLMGKSEALSLNGKAIGSKYNDDIGYLVGQNIMYLNRHLIRAFKEVEENFKPYLS